MPSGKAAGSASALKQRALALLGRDKKRLIMLLSLLLGVLLVLFSLPSGEDKAESEVGTLEEYKARLESELSELCSSVEGAGKCRVQGLRNIHSCTQRFVLVLFYA